MENKDESMRSVERSRSRLGDNGRKRNFGRGNRN